MKRTVYLEMQPLDQARRAFLSSFDWPTLVGVEELPTAEALGRVTAEPVFARWSSPSYHAAAMDGVALAAADTFGASDESPLRLALASQAWMVNTGHRLPPGTDAVVMIEQVHQVDDQTIELRAPAFPWQHVRKVGEDIVAGELLLPHHHLIEAPDVSALLNAGVRDLPVLARPKVAIIPTGSELVHWSQAGQDPPPAGQILETNSVFLASLVRSAGGEPVVLPPCPDQFEAILQAVQAALASEAHMVLLNAGASSGSKDYTLHVMRRVGEVLVHGVTVMPGKPSLLGRAAGKPLVGTPGYAVSAWVCFDQFIQPALYLMQAQEPPQRQTIEVTPARRLASKLGHEEFLRVHLGRVGDQVVATPLKRGAGTITSLSRADGLLRIGIDSDGIDEGAVVTAELLRPRDAVERTLVVAGSHDVTLDLLADHMKRRDPRLRVSSSHVGSMAGLVAIAAGRCHLGGTHLLDPDTGEYNVSYLRRFLQGRPARLVTLALRQQGFMVKPGNPLGISDISDLAAGGVRLVNRQAGSGTRVLLDYHLAQQGVDPDAIAGYDQEEYTHMAVAVQVAAGGADVGMGILAAARALGLDFIPVATERYDLCIPLDHWEDPRVRALLQTLESPDFRRAVAELGGYDVAPMGQVAWEG